MPVSKGAWPNTGVHWRASGCSAGSCRSSAPAMQRAGSSWQSCFFFQAEDGIRDYKVPGVQTCALPISWKHDAVEPLKFTNIADQMDVVVTAHGGGVGGQAGAVRMGLSRAISRFNPELRPEIGRASCRERV